MSADRSAEEGWSRLVAEAHRTDLLAVLESLSRALRRLDADGGHRESPAPGDELNPPARPRPGRDRGHPPPCILVGALALLMRERLSYTVLWDVDLLFPDEAALMSLATLPVPPGIRIVRVEEEPTGWGEIRSMHTLWRAHRTWINVDLMMREGFFRLHSRIPEGDVWLASPQTAGGRRYDIELPVAHPWNIFVDKLTSPRLKRSLEEGDMMSVDLRHAAALLRRDQEAPGFWEYVRDRAAEIGRAPIFAENLRLVEKVVPQWEKDADEPGGPAGPPGRS